MSMIELPDASLCVRLAATMGHFLWQGAAVYLLVMLAGLVLRRSSAHARYAVFLAALLIMAACPLATFVLLRSPDAPAVVVGGHSPPYVSSDAAVLRAETPAAFPGGQSPPYLAESRLQAAPTAAETASLAVPPEPAAEAIDWWRYAPWLVVCYLGGTSLMLVRLLVALCGGQRLRRRSEPVDDPVILAAFARQARALGVRFAPAIAFCREVAVPTVVGALRPMILLPLSAASGLTTEQIEVLLAHELAHIRRYDHLVNIVQRLIEAVLFFHPAVWFVSRRIRIEREHCCDDLVLAVGGQRFAYAESLVRMAELSGGGQSLPYGAAAAALGAADRPSQLRLRILRLISGSAGEQVRLFRPAVLGLCVFLMLAAVACVQLASRPTEDRPIEAVPPGMVGTWFFENPMGDDEQMAVFPDGQVVVLYSNGHRDETRYADGTIELAEYGNVKTKLLLLPDGRTLQTSGGAQGIAKLWRRIDAAPKTELLRPLTEPPATQPVSGILSENDISLLAMGRRSGTTVEWWKPTGETTKVEQEIESRAGVDGVYAVFRVASKDLTVAPHCMRGSGMYPFKPFENVPGTDKWIGLIDFPDERRYANMLIDISAPPWQTLYELPLTEADAGKSRQVDNYMIERVEDLTKLDERSFHLRIVHGQLEGVRFAAVDKQGQTHPARETPDPAVQVTELTFDLPLGQLRGIARQQPNRYRMSIHNISLRPGVRTNPATAFDDLEKLRRGWSDELKRRAAEVSGQPFVYKLPNGAVVQLVGLARLTAQGVEYWAPDGSPAENPGIREADIEEGGTFIVYRVLGEARSWHARVLTEEPSNREHRGSLVRSAEVWIHPIDTPSGTQFDQFAITSVQAAQYKDRARFEISAEDIEEEKSINRDGVARVLNLRRLSPKSFEVEIVYSDENPARGGYFAVDKAGGLHESTIRAAGPSRQHCSFDFPVEELTAMVCREPVHAWARFRGISLQPGQRTNVRAETGTGQPDFAKALTAAPKSKPRPEWVMLPSVDRKPGECVLDLASNIKLPLPDEEGDEAWDKHFAVLGKGDMAYDGQLLCFRGATAGEWKLGKIEPWEPAAVSGGLRRYELSKQPKSFLLTLANGDIYEINPSRIGGQSGIQFRHRKSDWFKQGKPIEGVVLGPDDKPVEGARIAFASSSPTTDITNNEIHYLNRGPVIETDAKGRYSFPPHPFAYTLVAMHDKGFAIKSDKELAKDPTLKLAAWARVEGTVRVGSKPAPYKDVRIEFDTFQSEKGIYLLMRCQAKTDKQGRYVMERVPPIPAPIYVSKVLRKTADDMYYMGRLHHQWIDPPAGKTLTVNLGGTGRAIVGRFASPAGRRTPIDWIVNMNMFDLKQPEPPYPSGIRGRERQEWLEAWRKTPEGHAHMLTGRRYSIRVEEDGSFRLDDIAPGTYALRFDVFEPAAGGGREYEHRIGGVQREIIVPETPGVAGDEPLDVGTLELGGSSAPITAKPRGSQRASNVPVGGVTTQPASRDPAATDETVKVSTGQADVPQGGSRAWYLLRQLNCGPLLRELPLQLAKASDPAVEAAVTREDIEGGVPLEIDVRLEDGATGEMLIGLFTDEKWSQIPVRVAEITGGGRHTIKGVPPGKYQIGAMMGTLVKPTALGVHKSWPQPVEVAAGRSKVVEVLVSPQFERALGQSYREIAEACQPGRTVASPDPPVQGRVTDSSGKPVAHVIVQIRQHGLSPGPMPMLMFDTATDDQGHYFLDKKVGRFTIGVLCQESLPAILGSRSQWVRDSGIRQGKAEINFDLKPFPRGSATLSGRCADQDGKPVQGLLVILEQVAEIDEEEQPRRTYSYRVPCWASDGRFALTDLPPGKHRMRWIPLDHKAYEFDPAGSVDVEMNEGQASEVAILIRRKGVLHGRVLMEDGAVPPAAVKPPWPGALMISSSDNDGAIISLVGQVDSNGHVMVRLAKKDREALDSGEAVLSINYPNPGVEKERVNWKRVGVFPFEKLSPDRARAGVVKIRYADLPESKPAESRPVSGTGQPLNTSTDARYQKASLMIRFDIPGAGEEAEFGLDGQGARRTVKIRNGGESILDDLPPGTYDFFRLKMAWGGGERRGIPCDRRTLTLAPGATSVVEVIRKEGHPLEGELVDQHESKIAGAFVLVRPAAAEGLSEREAIEFPILDHVASDGDGEWKTAIIPPGDYLVTAEAYKPDPGPVYMSVGSRPSLDPASAPDPATVLPTLAARRPLGPPASAPDPATVLPTGRRTGPQMHGSDLVLVQMTGPMPLAYVGTARVTVPKQGKPPRVRIEMKPADGASATPSSPPSESLPGTLEKMLDATVVIDAGHGGKDPGASGVSDVPEKTIVLDIARRLERALAGRVSRVIMTRSDDRFIELDQRAAVADREKADLFISIHADAAASRPDKAGAEVYLATQASYESLRSARSIRAAMEEEGIPCNRIQRLGARVLTDHSRPGVMLGVGWLTNKDDAARLKGGSYRQKMAETVAAGIISALADRKVAADGQTASQPAADAGVAGIVRLPDGAPVAEAEVICCTKQQGAQIYDDELIYPKKPAKTDAEGRFKLPAQTRPFLLIVRHERGYGQVWDGELGASGEITIRPWGGLKGTYRVGRKPGARVPIEVTFRPGAPLLFALLKYTAVTDEQGEFDVGPVPPVQGWIGGKIILRELDRGVVSGDRQGTPVDVKPGETAEVALGGAGRPVVGKATLSPQASRVVDLTWSMNCVAPVERAVPYPSGLDDETRQVWYEKWSKSEEGKEYRLGRQFYSFTLDASGQFRVEDVPAGSYELRIRVYEAPGDGTREFDKQIATILHEFVVPAMPSGRSDEPLDLGVLELKLDREKPSALSRWEDAARFLFQGGSRDEAATRFQGVADDYPGSDFGATAAELAGLLRAMAREDSAFKVPDDPTRLDEKQRIAYLVFRLRDVAETAISVPGRCQVLLHPRTPDSPAVAMRKLGKAAVPALMSLLDDRRPTRSIEDGPNGHHVLRYRDVALQIIEAIACRRFDTRTTRGAQLTNADAATQDEIVKGVRTWWRENEHKTEAEWIREGLGETGIRSFWSHIEAGERLIELEGPRSADFFRERLRAEPDDPWVIRLLQRAGGKAVLDDIRPKASHRDVYVRVQAYRALFEAGEHEVLGKAVADLNSALAGTNGETAEVLLGFLTRRGDQAAVEAAARAINHRNPEFAGGAVKAFFNALTGENRPVPKLRPAVFREMAAALDNDKTKAMAAAWMITAAQLPIQYRWSPDVERLETDDAVARVKEWWTKEGASYVEELSRGMPATRPAAGGDEFSWGRVVDGLRCRWVRTGEATPVGSSPTLSVEVENSSQQKITWYCPDEIVWGVGWPDKSALTIAATMPKFRVTLGTGVRVALEREVKRQFGVGRGANSRPDEPMPPYYVLQPGGRLTLTGQPSWKLPDADEHTVDCILFRYDPTGSKDLPTEQQLTCPPLKLQASGTGGSGPAPATPETRPSGSADEMQKRWPWVVEGRTTDTTGKPVSDVEVVASCGFPSGWRTGRVTSGADGRYTLRFTAGVAFARFTADAHAVDETPAEPAIPLQPAQIWAHKAGFSDRTVDLFMASSRPSGEDARRADPAKTVLPDQPYHLDLVLDAASSSTTRPEVPPRGRITGRVLNANTGQPVAGVDLAIDHRGDATSVSSTKRARDEGLYVAAKSRDDGSYELPDVALRDKHPLVVTCKGFIRSEQVVAVTGAQSVVTLDIRLHPGGTILGKVTDAQGKPLIGASVRVSAADGRMLDFTRAWAALPHRNVRTDKSGAFAIGELESGSFNIEVFQERRDGATYVGSVSGVKVVAGQATQVEVPNKPGEDEIVVTVEKPAGGDASSQKPNPAMPMVILSRDVGIVAWAAGCFHPEDERLLQILQSGWVRCGVDQDQRARFAGLPAGRYAVCVLDAAAEPGKRGSMVVIVGAQEVDLTVGRKPEARVKLPQPGPPARPAPRAFTRPASGDRSTSGRSSGLPVASPRSLAAAPRAPGDADSDGDGLSDFQEVHKYLTDPAKKDTDDDGVPDGDWGERREYTYSVRTVLRFMPPFDEAALNDDYQDARVIERTGEYAEVEVMLYPLATVADSITGNPGWKREYAGMAAYLAPGVTTNWDEKMRRDLLTELKAAGIDVDKLSDRQVVEQVSTWAMKRSRYLDKVFTTYYMYYPSGRPTVLPGLEDAFRREFERDKAEYSWTIDQHLDHELLGRGMYYNKTHGSCTSFAVYLTTVLRAVGIPARMIIAIPAVDGSVPSQCHLVRTGLTHHQVRQTFLQSLGRSGQGFNAHTFNEVYVGNRWHRLNYNKLGQAILDRNYLGLMTHVYTFKDLSGIDLASTWGRRYAKGMRSEAFRYGNPYTAVAISDQFGSHASVPNPPVVRSPRTHEKPNIFMMIPTPRGSSFDAFGAIMAVVKGSVWSSTGRYHTKLSYEEIFDGATHNMYPGDVLVLLFSLDADGGIVRGYEDLLPRPWPQIQADLEQGRTVELSGKARDLNVILLAAPAMAELKTLIQKTQLLRFGLPGGPQTSAPAAVSATSTMPSPSAAAAPKGEHRVLTIAKAYWFESEDRPRFVDRMSRMDDRDGHMLVHVNEWFDGQTSSQYNSFYDQVNNAFLLKCDGKPDVRAFAERGYWAQEFYVRVPQQEYAKMQPGLAYTLHPVNGSRDRQWRVSDSVTIRKPAAKGNESSPETRGRARLDGPRGLPLIWARHAECGIGRVSGGSSRCLRSCSR